MIESRSKKRKLKLVCIDCEKECVGYSNPLDANVCDNCGSRNLWMKEYYEDINKILKAECDINE